MKPGLAVLGACAGLLAIGLVLASDVALLAGQYEAPPSFSASQVLRPELLSSPNYRIGDRVGLENFQYAPRSRRVARGVGTGAPPHRRSGSPARQASWQHRGSLSVAGR